MDENKAVLFVDISGSTAFADKYGETAHYAMVERCFKVVVPELEKQHGRIVKYMGDGFLAVFDTAAAAVEAVVGMHSVLADDNATRPTGAGVRIHNGIDFGPVVLRPDGDVYGDTVNVAARVQHVAGPDQTYATVDVVKDLPPPLKQKTRRVGAFPLRGKEEDVEIFEIMWKFDGATMLFSRAMVREEARLSVFYGGAIIEMKPGQSVLTVGRVTPADVVVDDGAVSREHAEFVRRKGSIYLVDHSTNGTFVRPEISKARHLHREEFLLEGSGEFSLGRPDGPGVQYKVS
jgi:adenylate cyclase